MFTNVSLSLFRVLSLSFIFSRITIANLHMSNALLVTVAHVKMKLEDKARQALNNERLSLVMTKLPIKK